MIKKFFLILLLTLLVLTPVAALAATSEKDIWVEEVRINGSRDYAIIPGKELEMLAGGNVQLLLKLRKNSNARGVITLSSDLNRVEGLMKFRTEDYPEPVIEVKVSGIVPDALVNDGQTVIVGDRSFTLINIVYDCNGITQAIFNIPAIATNPELIDSKAKVAQTEDFITRSAFNEQQYELAKALLASAKQAREKGNPGLSIILCDLVKKSTNQPQTNSSLPYWYWGILVFFAIAFILMVLVLVNKNGRRQGGWIKARR